MGNGDNSNCFHISSYIFCTEKPANVEKSSTDTTETETQQPSTGEITSPPPSSSEATSAAHETTSAEQVLPKVSLPVQHLVLQVYCLNTFHFHPSRNMRIQCIC